ncbi:MAG: TetR family transcriptional regulator C-terminal domain-containing protein [Marmoricola sp.]|nr:TetR family transcriptional regulator C-terminal domain-containing protein [Marmoricola sp.]
MNGPNRRELAAEDARNRILAAATDCLVRDGLAKVRMAAIAREAGVSSGLLHYHFDTKEQLFAEVLAWSSAASAELTAQALAQAGDEPAQRLAAFLDRCLPSDEALAHEWLLWQELALLCMREPDLATVSAELYEDLYATGARLVEKGISGGVFDLPSTEARRVAETALALCDGLGGRVLSAGEALTIEQARTMVAEGVGQLVGHDGPLPISHRLRQVRA